jgi:peptidoglycan/LPS O-acetylase OafA/YrhL
VCLFTTYPDYILASGLNRSIIVAYQSLTRTLWSIVIVWPLFLCIPHQGGFVEKILSWSIWTLLAGLNYSCYLVHSTYQSHLLVNNFVSHIFFSYAAAIVVTILFETPFLLLKRNCSSDRCIFDHMKIIPVMSILSIDVWIHFSNKNLSTTKVIYCILFLY